MNNQFVLAILASVFSSTGGWGILQLVLTSRQKKAQSAKDARADEAESRRAREAEASKTWYAESRHHYDLANREATEARQEATAARKECTQCRKELEHTRSVVYMLFEEFEDQIIPMFTVADTDPIQVRLATRALMKRAREELNAKTS